MDIKTKFIAIFISLISSSTSCATTNEDFLDLLENSKIEGVRIGVDESIENNYCTSWNMTASEIKRYFALASKISGEERHNLYDWGGCSLEGKIIEATGSSIDFSINAGGTASVGINGKEVLFGCKTACNTLFDFGFYTE